MRNEKKEGVGRGEGQGMWGMHRNEERTGREEREGDHRAESGLKKEGREGEWTDRKGKGK